MEREFQVIIEKDTDGFFIADVPALKGCHTQAKSIDTLLVIIKDVIELCLEVEKDFPLSTLRKIIDNSNFKYLYYIE